MPRKVYTSTDYPVFAQQVGWRKWVSRLPFVRLETPYYVEVMPNGDMICNPATLPVVQQWMESNHIRFDVVAKLGVVK